MMGRAPIAHARGCLVRGHHAQCYQRSLDAILVGI
jgi:hypothetical protein